MRSVLQRRAGWESSSILASAATIRLPTFRVHKTMLVIRMATGRRDHLRTFAPLFGLATPVVRSASAFPHGLAGSSLTASMNGMRQAVLVD